MKKNLQLTLVAFAIGCLSLNAQTGRVAGTKTPLQSISVNGHNQKTNPTQLQRCSTADPGPEWDAWFNQKVEEFKIQQATNKTEMVNYTIPVIVHVIHSGEGVGVGTNISAAQIQDQINILNADFAGIGLNNGNVPSVWAGTKANCNVTFCLATKNPTGGTLAEAGIDRRHYNTIAGLSAPGSGYNTTTIDNTIKPATIWDPVRYCNMWVLKLGSSLLGYATFPAGTGLTGLSGPYGTTTSDGTVMGYNYFGSIGAAASSAPYNKGRTTTHEVGHWLGLRHINGDSNCGTDYCNDTPTQDQLHFGCFTYPYHTTQCSGNTTNGEMFMNFMDYTDDPCMYMFTNDQRTRIQTAMANGTYRSQLTASSATLCTLSASAPVANISIPTSGCSGIAVTSTNNTTGTPIPTYVWSANPSAGVSFSPNNTATTPGITFASPGTYTISCAATNSLGTNANSKVITVTNCAPICNDTLTNVSNTSTLNISIAGADVGTSGCSPKAGYIFGSNCYDDLEKAEFFPYSSYSAISTPKIKSVIVLFFKNGSQGTGGNASTPVSMKIYNGTMGSGPTGAAIGTIASNLGNITAAAPTTSVNYCGQPGIVFASPIILPYRFLFGTPVNAPASNGFFASITCPTAAGDTIVVMDDGGNSSGTNWELWSPSGWYNISTAWGGFDASMAVLPEISCNATGIDDTGLLSSNVALMPNPTTGLFNIIATLPSKEDIKITVTNSLGQLISETSFVNVTNNAFTVDLSNHDNGVYFVTISSPTEKVVRKVVLTK